MLIACIILPPEQDISAWRYITLTNPESLSNLRFEGQRVCVNYLQWLKNIPPQWVSENQDIYTGWSKSLCAPHDYNTKNTQK
jgi:hypothetical protein